MDSNQTLRENIVETLSQQLSELELLKSMYPAHDDIVFSDYSVLEDMKNFIDNKSFSIPNNLDFVLKLSIDGLKLEVFVSLPSFYPKEEPNVNVRCNQFNRHQETKLNSEMLNYLRSVFEKEVCLYSVISWLHENIESFKINNENLEETHPIKGNKDETFVRLWIFSHHIYSKHKREEIIKKSKEYNLTGFCLPGKPGIICIEGSNDDCNEWWKIIKSLNWKKITIRKTEIFNINEKIKEQKFDFFQEMSFQNTTFSSKAGFANFLKEHKLNQEFNEFLGI